MAKKLYLHIKWDETIEKNGSEAGDDGIRAGYSFRIETVTKGW